MTKPAVTRAKALPAALAVLRDERALAWRLFMDNGGRGIRLADEIDTMDRKIALMERDIKKAKP